MTSKSLIIMLLASVGLPSIRAQSSSRSLQSVGLFDLESRLPNSYRGIAVTHAVVAKEKSLYFLISPPRTIQPPQAILQTDLNGNLLMFIPLVRPVDPTWLEVGESGLMYMCQLFRPKDTVTTVDVYTPEGRLKTTLESQTIFTQFGRIGNQFFGATTDGKVSSFASRETLAQVGVKRAASLHFRSLPGTEIVAVNPHVPELWVVDVQSGKTFSKRIEAPEITRAWAAYQADPTTAVIIGDITTDTVGHIYAVVTGHPLSVGAVILVLGRDGSVQDSIRCPPPSTAARVGVGNPGRYISPGLLAVSGERLYVIDQTGYVGVYSLQ